MTAAAVTSHRAPKIKPPCVACGDPVGRTKPSEKSPFRARGMCLRCYDRSRCVSIPPCATCGDPAGRPYVRGSRKGRPVRIHGMCGGCYDETRREADARQAAQSRGDADREQALRLEVAGRILAFRHRSFPDECRLPVVCPTCARPPTFGPSSRMAARECVALYLGAAKRLGSGRGLSRSGPLEPGEPHYYGVVKDYGGKRRLPYWGQLYIGDRRYCTRYFLTGEQAARAADDLIRLHGGDLSRLNFPDVEVSA